MKNHRLLAVIAVMLILACIATFVLFGSFNFPRVAIGLVQILSGNTQVVQVGSFPNRVMLASPDNAYAVFESYLLFEGYEIKANEQMGSLHVISKNGRDEHVFFSVNGYYSSWRWRGL